MKNLLLSLLLLTGSAHAAVYKYVVQGKTVYTDAPCTPTAEPATLPPLTAVPSAEAFDLAAERDARLAREKTQRDTADRRFVQQHAENAARAKAVRAAILDHRVVEGMTPSEVHSAIGSPDETLPNGNTRHVRDGQRITVSYRDGVVSRVTVTARGAK